MGFMAILRSSILEKRMSQGIIFDRDEAQQ